MSPERSTFASRALVVVLVIAGIVAGAFTFLRERDPGGGQIHPNDSLAVVTVDGELEIRDGRSGDLLRLMRQDLEVGRVARIVVTPDGRFAYHDATSTRCGARRVPAIARVDLINSATRFVAAGHSPALSPDGSRLAYLTPTDDGKRPSVVLEGERPVCRERSGGEVRDLLVVRELRTEEERRWGEGFEPFADPRWLDGLRLYVLGGGEAAYSIVDVVDGGVRPAPSLGPFVPTQPLSSREALGADCSQIVCNFALVGVRDGEVVEPLASLRPAGRTLAFAELHGARDLLLAGWSDDGERATIAYDLGTDRAVDLGEDVAAATWLPND